MKKILLLIFCLLLLISCSDNHITLYDAFKNAKMFTAVPVLLLFYYRSEMHTKQDYRFKSGYRHDKKRANQTMGNGIKYAFLVALLIGIPLTLIFYIFNINIIK